MSQVGKVGWFDLTVPDATAVCDFYREVVGWDRTEVPMDGYQDYCIHPSREQAPIGGICHQRGPNQNWPSQWLMYVTVEDLHRSTEACKRLGGKVLIEKRGMGSYGTVAVIEDPTGAVMALLEPATDKDADTD